MSSISRISSGKKNDCTDIASEFTQDFTSWLTSLQSGNVSEAKTAFAALKKDFQNEPQAPAGQTSNKTASSAGGGSAIA